LTPAGFLGGLVVDVLVDAAIQQAIQTIGALAAQADSISKSLKDTIFPDGAVRGPDGKIDGFTEYKFKCPPGVKSGKGLSTGRGVTTWSPGQERKMKDLVNAIKINDPGAIDPEAAVTLISNIDC
jgi:hypothetical protein